MAALGKKLRSLEGGLVAFLCPGCGMHHQVRVEGEGRPKWTYNGNPNAPTFQPSILFRSGHYAQHFDKEKHGDCWCTYKERYNEEPAFNCVICHSFVTDGKIQFLSDCSHSLAGQTVDLPDVHQ